MFVRTENVVQTMTNHYVEYYAEQAALRARKQLKRQASHDDILLKGCGIGGVFSNVYRYLKPFIASGLDILKEESIKTAGDIILGINQQKPINEILTDRGVEVIDKIRDTAVKKITRSMVGGKISSDIKKPLKRMKKRKKNQSSVDCCETCTSSRKRFKSTSDIFE